MRSLKFFAAVALVSIVNVLALVAIAGYMRASAGGPYADVNGDCNGDGWINLADPVYLLNFLFSSGPPPVAIASGPQLTAEQAEMLSHMSIEYLDDGQGGTAKTIRFTGVNVQIVNGLGATNGNPSNPADTLSVQTNGVGNLILGYNEAVAVDDERTGSHNLIVGYGLRYTSCAGIAAGLHNMTAGPYSSAIAGAGNRVNGVASSTVGGYANEANSGATIIGGGSNSASGGVVVSGNQNNAIGSFSLVCGGVLNIAQGDRSLVLGGQSNDANALLSTVVGGGGNICSGDNSTCMGGNNNSAVGFSSAIFGGSSNVASGNFSVVTGGGSNQADGDYSAASGGFQRSAVGQYDWVAGSLFEDQ
ncbi:MAG: hypothetical protein ACKVX7_12560 [Planctomycetota bacterium]